jgi:hypothetical protein
VGAGWASVSDGVNGNTLSEISMAKRNQWDGFCSVCRKRVRAYEGVVESAGPHQRYRILCPEHAPEGSLDAPKPPEASSLPSIHVDRFDGPT